MAEKVLVVEDEADILTGLEVALGREGYQVTTAQDGEEGLKKAAETAPDVIILDVMLPGMDGYEVCSALRERGIRTPVIMLTAKTAEDDRVRGLDTGADDYVVKPFSMRELIARVRAVWRRRAEKEARIHQFSFGNVKVDFDRQTVSKKGKTIALSSYETWVLRLLVSMRGEAVSRQTILARVWGYDFAADTRTIDNHVVQLRQKIEDDPHHPKHILTAHGKGYKFVQ